MPSTETDSSARFNRHPRPYLAFPSVEGYMSVPLHLHFNAPTHHPRPIHHQPWDKIQRLGEASHPGPAPPTAPCTCTDSKTRLRAQCAAAHRAARPPKGEQHLDIFVQNISYFGAVSKNILTNLADSTPSAAKCDGFCFQETHTPAKALVNDQNWVDRHMSTISSWSPARAGEDAQDRHSVGGTLTACKKYVNHAFHPHHTADHVRLDWSPVIITGRII